MHHAIGWFIFMQHEEDYSDYSEQLAVKILSCILVTSRIVRMRYINTTK